ncbi:hypothetical protein SFRURICE_002805 [Spodoptera frugiperda]|nr:hypothetical protein SFRURICE_002805 [Spodoptera frugiperda]
MRRDDDAARLNQTPPVQISDSHDHDKALGTCAMHFQRDQQKLRSAAGSGAPGGSRGHIAFGAQINKPVPAPPAPPCAICPRTHLQPPRRARLMHEMNFGICIRAAVPTIRFRRASNIARTYIRVLRAVLGRHLPVSARRGVAGAGGAGGAAAGRRQYAGVCEREWSPSCVESGAAADCDASAPPAMATLGLSKVFILDKYFTELQRFWETEKKLQGERPFTRAVACACAVRCSTTSL